MRATASSRTIPDRSACVGSRSSRRGSRKAWHRADIAADRPFGLQRLPSLEVNANVHRIARNARERFIKGTVPERLEPRGIDESEHHFPRTTRSSSGQCIPKRIEIAAKVPPALWFGGREIGLPERLLAIHVTTIDDNQ